MADNNVPVDQLTLEGVALGVNGLAAKIGNDVKLLKENKVDKTLKASIVNIGLVRIAAPSNVNREDPRGDVVVNEQVFVALLKQVDALTKRVAELEKNNATPKPPTV